MALSDVPPQAFLHLLERVRLRRCLPEQYPMNVLGRMTTGSTHHDRSALFLPLQYGARAQAQFATHLGRHRDLALRGELRMSERHRVPITTVMYASPSSTGAAPEGQRHRQLARRSFETRASARKCLTSAVSRET